MADAKRCDDCGRFYDPEDLKKEFTFKIPIKGSKRPMDVAIVVEQGDAALDLCPECLLKCISYNSILRGAAMPHFTDNPKGRKVAGRAHPRR